jgi:hypothetical protein
MASSGERSSLLSMSTTSSQPQRELTLLPGVAIDEVGDPRRHVFACEVGSTLDLLGDDRRLACDADHQ